MEESLSWYFLTEKGISPLTPFGRDDNGIESVKICFETRPERIIILRKIEGVEWIRVNPLSIVVIIYLMTKRLLLAILVTLTLSFPFYSYLKKEVKVLPITMTAAQPGSLVIARVGIFTLNEISGWTSPFAEVTMTSWNLARKTVADGSGFFAFYNIPIRENTGDICFIAEDVNRVANFPTCISPLIPTDNLVIKNILLAPSILVSKGIIDKGKPVSASGMTFPDSEVDIRVSNVIANVVANFSSRPWWQGLQSPLRGLKSATTYTSLKTRSNQFGFYETSLPTNNISENRIYSSSALSPSLLTPDPLLTSQPHPQYSSPKSNTLTFFVVRNMLWIIILLILILLAIIILLFLKDKIQSLMIVDNKMVKKEPVCETEILSWPKLLRT